MSAAAAPRRRLVAAAQLGPVARTDTRAEVVERLMTLLREAHRRGATFVVFPELALTTFFPRWFIEDERELDAFYESALPNAATRPLFELAAGLGVAFCLGYAERVEQGGEVRRFNTSILVDESGRIVGRYRKIHLPGHAEHEPWRAFQHLEKRYFEHGDLGFPTFEACGGTLGLCLCNDRRWPETFRLLALAGAELVALGYNTPRHYPPAPEHDHLQDFHNHLCLQGGAYANGCWVVASAKAGLEEGCELIGGSCIVAPTGEIVARAQGLGDELVLAEVDLERCREIREHIFDFAAHRRPGDYGPLVE